MQKLGLCHSGLLDEVALVALVFKAALKTEGSGRISFVEPTLNSMYKEGTLLKNL